jgi:hypothetical protein
VTCCYVNGECIDDVSFIKAVVADLAKRLPMAPGRVGYLACLLYARGSIAITVG